jgi:hypothetical protein
MMRGALVVLTWLLLAALAVAQPARAPYGPVSSGISAASPLPTMRTTGYTAFTTNPAGGNITMFDSPVGISMTETDFGGDNLNAACKTTPIPPYTITAHVTVTQDWENARGWAGLAWFDPTNTAMVATGPLAATDLTPHHTSVFSLIFTNPTTWSQTTIGGAYSYSPSAWVRYQDDGTNWTISWSADGFNYYQFFHNPKFASYTQVCIFLSANGSNAGASFNSYTETSP